MQGLRAKCKGKEVPLQVFLLHTPARRRVAAGTMVPAVPRLLAIYVHIFSEVKATTNPRHCSIASVSGLAVASMPHEASNRSASVRGMA